MKLFTKEYTVLLSLDGGKDVTIKPNIEFKPFKGKYKVTCSALIKEVDTNDLIAVLKPGAIIDGVGEIKESRLEDLSAKELRQTCREAGVSFKSKATKKDLLSALGVEV